MSSTDFLSLGKHKIIENVKESLPKNLHKALNVVTVKDNVLFTWDFQSHCVLTLNIKAAIEHENNSAVICQKLLPVSPPLFPPEKIVANEIGTLLIVAGPNGVLVFDLPTRCPPYGSFNNNKELVYCRTHSLDERLLTCSDTVEVLQVKFHPGSVKDNHILILTSDNTLRLYQVENEVIKLGVFLVGDKPVAKMPGSKITFLGALGEIAVDFDFGHPEINEKKSLVETNNIKNESDSKSMVEIFDPLNDSNTIITVREPERETSTGKFKKKYSNFDWPVYVLSGDFVVTTINIPLYDRTECPVKGPIPLIPNSILQYDRGACSILCLNSTPQVLCIGSTNGEILHGIVLPIEDDEIKQEKSTSVSWASADREIYFFEAVDIELGLTTSTPLQEEGYTCPIFLHRDESRCDKYFATHSAGVHTVSIGCMDDLQKFESSESANDVFSISSTPEYLICTKTSTSKSDNPVIGFSVYYNPNSIIALLANGSLLSLALIAVSTLPKIENLCLASEEVTSSPLKEMLKMPFDVYIQNLLKKGESHPIMKLSKNEEHTLKECHELMQKTSQIFKEKFKYHTMAKEEIEKRATAIHMFKDYQLKELANMNQEKHILREKAESLAEKYEDTRDKQELLLKRCAKLLMLLSMKKEVLSDAEGDYLVQLREMRGKLDKCDSAIDKLVVKKNYQESQMRNWKKQQEKKTYSISETHRKTVTDSLTDSSTRINEMVDQVKSVKRQLHLK